MLHERPVDGLPGVGFFLRAWLYVRVGERVF